MDKPSVRSYEASEEKTRERAAELREKWLSAFKPGKVYDVENPKMAAEWREKWLSGIKFGESYDVEAHYRAARWAIKWSRNLLNAG